MFDQLRNYISTYGTLTHSQIDQVVGLFSPIRATRGQVLLDKGKICHHLYFVCRGSIRMYYLQENGEEATRFVAFDDMMGGALSSFITQEPTLEYVQAVEKSELLAIERKDFYLLTDTIPA